MSTSITREDVFLTIDHTQAGGVIVIDASLVGWSYGIERRGFGTMQPGIDYSLLVDENGNTTGGWRLLANGDTLKLNELFIYHFVDNLPPPSQTVTNTGITNGFNVGKIFNALQGRLGWAQPTLSGSPVLNGFNLASSSGRYFNDGSFHASCNIQLLYQSQEDEQISDANFNALLTRLNQTAIMRCLNAVFNKPQLIERSLIYERTSNIRNVNIPNGGNFCGYRIKVAQGDYAAMINTVGLFFSLPATFNLYLFNDLQALPLQTKSVTVVGGTQTIVQLSWQLDYLDSGNKGGLFYIGYFQDDLVASGSVAVDEQLNLWADTKIFGAYPFQAPKIGALNFNRINPSVVFRTYGMQLEISAFRDYTQTIVQNSNMFDEAQGLTMAILVVDQIRNSQRTNPSQRQSAEQLKQLKLDMDLAFPTKDAPLIAGLRAQLIRELRRINDNFFTKPEAQIVRIGADSNNPNFAYDTFDIANLPPREQFY